MNPDFDSTPDLKTLEEFCEYYEKDTPDNKAILFKNYQWAMKERMRYKIKDKKRRERLKQERKVFLEQHPEQKKKVGRPRKHIPVKPENSNPPGAAV